MQAGCQCGTLTAEIEDGAEPVVILCHCLECQKRSGSPFGAMAYYPDGSVTVNGEAREYARPTDSGHTYTTGFCPTCGSTLYGRSSGFTGMFGVSLGTIGDPSFVPPARSVYEQSRHHWLALPEDLPGFARGRGGMRTR